MNPMAKKSRWFKEKSEVYQSLFPLMERVGSNQQYRRSENLIHARLYGNVDIIGLTPGTYARPNPVSNGARPRFNVVASCVETLASKISKSRPRPQFITSGADWQLQQKAKKLSQFIVGQFYQSQTYEESDKCFIDACVFGTGIMKVYRDSGTIKNERVIPEEIVVDDAEAMHGKPRNMYQRKAVSRDVLKSMFPKQASLIDDLPSVDEDWGMMNADDVDFVEVVEAWHLRSSPTAKDGRHCMVTKNCDLLCEPWEKDKFPFAVMRFRRRLAGWFGQGIPEIIAGIQVDINRILRNNQISQYLHSAPAWLVEENSSVVSAHLNNDIGHIVKYRGIPPELKTWASVNPEMYQQINVHIQRAYEEIGISQLSATSQKPAGLDSGKALREYNDIESERFIKLGQSWEQFHLDIADLMIDEARAISEEDPSYAVNSKGKKFLQSIKWKSVDMDRECYQMACFPTSQLPNTPAGRMAYIQELMTAGFIDPDTGQELLEMPDLDRFNDLRFSGRQVVRENIGAIVDDGKYTPPEPFQDLNYSFSYAQMMYNYSKLHGAPETSLELLRRYMQQVKALQDMANPPPPPAPLALAQGPMDPTQAEQQTAPMMGPIA